jgi:hypothetical protein
MRPEDVVSPISLFPIDLEQFRKAWVHYLEREGITADRQPMVTDVADYCFAMGIAFSYPHTSLTPFEYEPSATPPEEDKGGKEEARIAHSHTRARGTRHGTVDARGSASLRAVVLSAGTPLP